MLRKARDQRSRAAKRDVAVLASPLALPMAPVERSYKRRSTEDTREVRRDVIDALVDGTDVMDCGAGRDIVRADPDDRLRGCGVVRRS